MEVAFLICAAVVAFVVLMLIGCALFEVMFHLFRPIERAIEDWFAERENRRSLARLKAGKPW